MNKYKHMGRQEGRKVVRRDDKGAKEQENSDNVQTNCPNQSMIKMKKKKKYRNLEMPEGTNQVNEPDSIHETGEALTFEKVWVMFQETDKKFQEASKKTQETERILKEQSRETDRILKEQSRETDKKLQETERILKDQFRETARLISELREEYKNRWGELIESLVSGNLLRMLEARGIPVSKTRKHVMQYKGEPNYEFDILASNGDEVVVVEVKSTLNPWGVKHFIDQIKLARKTSRRFRKQRIIGAVAYLNDHCDASTMAMKRGLLVIRAPGDSAVIINDKDFVPLRF